MNEAKSRTAKRVVILGHGAMGTVFGVALQRAGHDVVFLGRAPSDTSEPLPKEIELVSLEGIAEHVQIDAVRDPGFVAEADLVIVLVKAPDTAAAIDHISPFLSRETPVVTLQNGLRTADRIRAVIGSDNCVIAGVTNQAAMRISPLSVVHTGAGPTRIGTNDVRALPSASCIAGLLTEAGLPTAVVDSIDRELWQKVAVNAAINGPTALCGTTNGAIAVEPELRGLANEIANEAVQVAASQGIELPNMEDAVIGTATASATNRSSMLQDIETGRPTEADAIYGEIQRVARHKGIATPRIDALAVLIDRRSRAAESKERAIEQFA